MEAILTSSRLRLLVLGAAVAVALLLVAAPALAAPRWGTTAVRGVPSEAVAHPVTAGGAHALTAASVRAPAGRTDPYLVFTPLAVWVAGAVGAVLLLGGARRYALSQRRGQGGRLAEFNGRRPPSSNQDRRAA